MDIRTSISQNTEDDTIVRGHKLSEVSSFTDAIFLLIGKRLPDKTESKIFEKLLVLSCEHGAGTASSLAARMVASTGNPLNAAGAAGILALGEKHGGAVSRAMEQLLLMHSGTGSMNENAMQFVKEALAKKKLLYGFGHKEYKEEDPRTLQLLDLCKNLKYESRYLELALATENALEETKGRRIMLNIDGCMAALLLSFGFEPKAGNAVFYAARLPGLLAHALEEQETGDVRRVPDCEIRHDE